MDPISSFPPAPYQPSAAAAAPAFQTPPATRAQDIALIAMKAFALLSAVGLSIAFLATGSALVGIAAIGFSILSICLLNGECYRVHTTARPFLHHNRLIVVPAAPTPIFAPSFPCAHQRHSQFRGRGVAMPMYNAEERIPVGNGGHVHFSPPAPFIPAPAFIPRRQSTPPVMNGGSAFAPPRPHQSQEESRVQVGDRGTNALQDDPAGEQRVPIRRR